MKHVSERWLQKLHLFYTIIAALSIVAYLAFAFISPIHKYNYRVGDSPLIFIMPAILVIYNFAYYPVMRKRNQWTATWLSYFILTLFFVFALDPTGGYSSIWVYVWGICGFLGGMLGLYAAVFPVALMFVGAVLTFTGAYPIHSSYFSMGVALAIDFSLYIFGWLIWREFYDKESSLPANSKSFQDQLLKSDSVLNAMTDGVMVIDPKNTIVALNKGGAEIMGWPVNEAIGLDYHSVIQLLDDKGKPYSGEQDIPANSIKTGKPLQDNEAYLLSRSKKKISASISVSPLFDDQKELTAAVVVFRDVSAERQAQQQRADFISTASHEMRTPVAAIEGYLALALNDKVSTIDSRARGFLEKAHTSTQSLGKLFQDLLTSAKADDGRLSNHPTPVEMTKFLEDISNDFRFTAQKKGLTTDFIMGSSQVVDATTSTGKMIPPLYYVYADPERLREVITNLFDNAVKYTDQGKITIGLTADATNVQFYVKDMGAGIAAEDIPHLFQKFYRVDNSATRSIGGTGLGLFISKKIIELYQGQVWVESELGKGSTFFVNLPRLSTKQAEELQRAQDASSSPLSV